MIPARQKPKFGMAGIIPGHPLTPKFFLPLNEGGGKTVWDLVGGKPYALNAAYAPTWVGNGLDCNADREYIIGPALNDILPAGSSTFTVFFVYRHTTAPSSSYFFYTTGTTHNIFSLYQGAGSTTAVVYIGGSYFGINTANYLMSYTTIAVVGNGSGIKIYGNGRVVGTNANVPTIPSTANVLNIGGYNQTLGRHAGGIISYYYVNNRDLSGAEIAQLSSNPNCWLFDKAEILTRLYAYISSGGSTTISDTGSGSDTISITVKRTITDSGAGVDTNSLLSQIQTQDTGAGTEVLSVLAQILKQDSGTGLDIISLLAQFAIQDAGTGSDSVNIAQGIVEKLIQDSGIGSETIALMAQTLIQDSGSGAELLSLFVRRVIQDSGAAIDAVDIVAGVVQKLVQDEGTANEVINIITQIIKQDSGTGIDFEAINKAVQILDSGTGVDVIEVIKAGLRLYCFLSGEWKSAKLKVFDNGSFKEKTLKLFGNGQWN